MKRSAPASLLREIAASRLDLARVLGLERLRGVFRFGAFFARFLAFLARACAGVGAPSGERPRASSPPPGGGPPTGTVTDTRRNSITSGCVRDVPMTTVSTLGGR